MRRIEREIWTKRWINSQKGEDWEERWMKRWINKEQSLLAFHIHSRGIEQGIWLWKVGKVSTEPQEV